MVTLKWKFQQCHLHYWVIIFEYSVLSDILFIFWLLRYRCSGRILSESTFCLQEKKIKIALRASSMPLTQSTKYLYLRGSICIGVHEEFFRFCFLKILNYYISFCNSSIISPHENEINSVEFLLTNSYSVTFFYKEVAYFKDFILLYIDWENNPKVAKDILILVYRITAHSRKMLSIINLLLFSKN